MANQHKDLQDQLNRSMPIAKNVGLGDTLQELISAYNDLAIKHNTLVSVLDAENGELNLVPDMLTDSPRLKDINDRR